MSVGFGAEHPVVPGFGGREVFAEGIHLTGFCNAAATEVVTGKQKLHED